MKLRALLLTSVMILPLTACAQEAGQASNLADDSLTRQTVQKVIDGYGGDKFENLKSLTVKSDLRYGWLGQGQYPDYTDLNAMRKIHHYDLERGWASEEAWGGNGGYAERVFTTDKGHYEVNYLNKTYEIDEEGELYGHFGAEMRTSDVLLAYDMMKHRDTAEHKGTKMFRGVMHDLLTYDMPGTDIDPVLWVNSETGHISKMRRVVPNYSTYNYVFGNFQSSDGITYSDDFELYSDDKLVEYAKSVKLSVNDISPSIWRVEAGMSPAPETISADEMVVDPIAGAVHYAGQGGAWSAFVDAGEYIIGMGGYGGLGERFKAYQDAQGHSKPLKYHIMTHHHSDHLEGAPDALELGAQIVAPEAARANLEELTEKSLSEAEYMVISEAKTVLGPVDIYLISTGHAPEFALPYMPSIKLVFDEDHYFSNFKDQAAWISPNAMSLIDEVQRVGLSPNILVTAHSRKVESWPAILEMAKLHTSGLCPTGREICRDLIK